VVTQRELAKLGGVSAGTVSNVISGSTRVSEDARSKVLDAIRVLKYQPNQIARSEPIVPTLSALWFPTLHHPLLRQDRARSRIGNADIS
jgi:transcriptional regulator with XRE-family HTH domain